MFSRDAPTQGRLQVGPFIIAPAFAMIMPGGNIVVSVECLPESDVPRKFEEVINRSTLKSRRGSNFVNPRIISLRLLTEWSEVRQ